MFLISFHVIVVLLLIIILDFWNLVMFVVLLGTFWGSLYVFLFFFLKICLTYLLVFMLSYLFYVCYFDSSFYCWYLKYSLSIFISIIIFLTFASFFSYLSPLNHRTVAEKSITLVSTLRHGAWCGLAVENRKKVQTRPCTTLWDAFIFYFTTTGGIKYLEPKWHGKVAFVSCRPLLWWNGKGTSYACISHTQTQTLWRALRARCKSG